jgi:hypothetical protein
MCGSRASGVRHSGLGGAGWAAVALGMTTAVEASASKGNSIRSSRSEVKEDRSNHGNDGSSSNCKGGHDCCTLHNADGADNADDGGNDQRRRPQAMLLGAAV